MHIGVLEDNPLILDCICSALELDGHTVGAYLDAASLLEALFAGASTNGCFGLVITDLNLPGSFSGEDVVERIKSDSRYAHLAVIVVTAAAQQRTARVQARFPALAIIHKPFHIDDLLRCVAEAGTVGMS